MQRRRFLVVGGSLALAGCLDSLAPRSEPVRPAELLGSTFETDVNTDLSSRESEPRITADRQAATVTVEGVGRYGSSRCGYLAAEEPSYDPETAALVVRVTAEQDRSGDSVCEDDEAASSYRLIADFDEGVPARVGAVQPFEETTTEEFP